MPTYTFKCDEDTGCGHIWEFTCLMSELDEKRPKSCPQCKKRKSIHQVFGDVTVSLPKTLGSLAERNTNRMSEDERTHLHKKHNEYREAPPSWEATKDGIKRKNIQRE